MYLCADRKDLFERKNMTGEKGESIDMLPFSRQGRVVWRAELLAVEQGPGSSLHSTGRAGQGPAVRRNTGFLFSLIPYRATVMPFPCVASDFHTLCALLFTQSYICIPLLSLLSSVCLMLQPSSSLHFQLFCYTIGSNIHN